MVLLLLLGESGISIFEVIGFLVLGLAFEFFILLESSPARDGSNRILKIGHPAPFITV